MVKLLPACFILGGLSLMLGCAATAPRSPSSSSPKSEAPPAVTTPVSKARSTAKDVQQKALERSTLAPTAPTDPPPSPQP